MAEAARRAATIPGTQPIHLYKNNTDNKGASYGAHENYLMRRQTPFADIVAHLTPFFVTRQIVCGAGRVGIGQDGSRRRLPDLPARRLLRGRGRPGDHAQAADHQHPRRAALRRRQVPPAARHHRRRQPLRDLDLPQGRHHRAGPRDDRGEGRSPRDLGIADPVCELQGGQPRPVADAPDAAARRPPADRAGPAVGLLRAGPRLRRRPVRRRRRRADRRRAGPLGGRAGPARPRPDALRRRAGLGGQAAAAGGLPGAGEARLGVAQAATGRPAVLRRAAGEGPLPPAGRPRVDEDAARPTSEIARAR